MRFGSRHWFAILIITTGVAIQLLNFTGFCYGQGRWFSDRELEDIAIREQMKRQDVADPERNKIYRSASELRAENPGCYEVYRSGNELPASLFSRSSDSSLGERNAGFVSI